MIIFIHFPIQLSADLPEDSLLLTSHHNMGYLPVAMIPKKPILQRLLSAVNSSPINLGRHGLVSHPCWNCTQLDPVYVTATAVMNEITVVSRRQHFIAPLSSIALTSSSSAMLSEIWYGSHKNCLS